MKKDTKTPRQTKAQKKSAVIGLLRNIAKNLDSICESVSNAQTFADIQQETKSIDLVIDNICEL